jgi:prepilin-type N-terminal cleavage/methylation domain-containing protein
MDHPYSERIRCRAFTLIEILIVISIIALLASLVLVAVQRARINAMVAVARTTVTGLDIGLSNYRDDEGDLPGIEDGADPDENRFPALYRALCGARRPVGPGGRSAPYFRPSEADVVVAGEEAEGLRKAHRDEILDDQTDKYLLDPFGEPYVYRVREMGRGRPPRADIYSTGPDHADGRASGEEGDDIGNW